MARTPVIALAVLTLAAALGGSAASSSSTIVHVRFRFVDHTRVARFRDGTRGPRTLVTYVRVPAGAHRPLPLVVFAHGFSVTPGTYARLLDAWTRAGYVVAAPVFPVESRDAPGGPDESDLVNQPGDVSFVISRLLAALHDRIDARRIAVAGQSDGAETALAVADETHYRDPRVRAAVILSGAQLPGGELIVGRGSAPLLATQGTADTINPPGYTYSFFRAAGRPKFLLRLLGAGHLPPYTTDRRQLAVVERSSIAFLDAYLRHGSLRRLLAAAAAPGVARLTAEP